MPEMIKNPTENNENKRKILFLGRMNKEGFYQKGPTDLINAIFLLGERFSDNAICTIIGDGEYYDHCNAIVQKYNLSKSILLVRKMPHDELIMNLSLSDIVVLPSRFEGMSMFALEALYTQNVCLFSDTGGLVDMIPNRDFTYPPQNIEALAEVIDKAVHLNIKELEHEKMKAYQKALTFSNEEIKHKFDKVYKILAKEL